jgi:methyl-accepting chemotaxis protein
VGIQRAETAEKAQNAAEHEQKVVTDTIEEMRPIAEVVRKSAGTVQELGKSRNPFPSYFTE